MKGNRFSSLSLCLFLCSTSSAQVRLYGISHTDTIVLQESQYMNNENKFKGFCILEEDFDFAIVDVFRLLGENNSSNGHWSINFAKSIRLSPDDNCFEMAPINDDFAYCLSSINYGLFFKVHVYENCTLADVRVLKIPPESVISCTIFYEE